MTIDTETTQGSETVLLRAVEYVRMSTDSQQYSIANQQEAIRRYATERGLNIVRTYADRGKSGLRLCGRAALIRLLDEVQSGLADFKIILVYDVSRWGRFQDTDESGYYEYLCRKSKVRIEYCAEPFENDGGPLTTVLKSIKRSMAAEFSRELSVKVYAAMCRLTKDGYLHGGIPTYGLRRMLIGPDGVQKGILQDGQHKNIKSDRVILVPGPPDEIEVIRRIFRHYIEHRMSMSRIGRLLNAENIPHPAGIWNHDRVKSVITNERYLGSITLNGAQPWSVADPTARALTQNHCNG